MLLLIRCFTYNNGNLSPGSYNENRPGISFLKFFSASFLLLLLPPPYSAWPTLHFFRYSAGRRSPQGTLKRVGGGGGNPYINVYKEEGNLYRCINKCVYKNDPPPSLLVHKDVSLGPCVCVCVTLAAPGVSRCVSVCV